MTWKVLSDIFRLVFIDVLWNKLIECQKKLWLYWFYLDVNADDWVPDQMESESLAIGSWEPVSKANLAGLGRSLTVASQYVSLKDYTFVTLWLKVKLLGLKWTHMRRNFKKQCCIIGTINCTVNLEFGISIWSLHWMKIINIYP